MQGIIRILRKLLVAAIGIPLLIIGIILIPLPGPGFLVCFLALFILSLEFKIFRKYFEFIKTKLKKIIDEAKIKYQDIDKKYK